MRKFSGARRTFLGATNRLIGAASVASVPLSAARPQQKAEGDDYYEKLGVTKIINAAGTYTALTASIMPPPVQAAVARAAQNPVRLAELHTKAGEYIAGKLRCEAALITAGAASAITLGTAGCMT